MGIESDVRWGYGSFLQPSGGFHGNMDAFERRYIGVLLISDGFCSIFEGPSSSPKK